MDKSILKKAADSCGWCSFHSMLGDPEKSDKYRGDVNHAVLYAFGNSPGETTHREGLIDACGGCCVNGRTGKRAKKYIEENKLL
ncbi:MAG: hypothetical protein JW754_02905 [Candidatus Aenigmarchaeota archaeon]|nr:hypothetical protein [Candidatus Aenigmarchaeota archaeon]